MTKEFAGYFARPVLSSSSWVPSHTRQVETPTWSRHTREAYQWRLREAWQGARIGSRWIRNRRNLCE